MRAGNFHATKSNDPLTSPQSCYCLSFQSYSVGAAAGCVGCWRRRRHGIARESYGIAGGRTWRGSSRCTAGTRVRGRCCPCTRSDTFFNAESGRTRTAVRIHKTMFLRVIGNGRIPIRGNNTRSGAALKYRSRNANWGRGRRKAVAESFLGRGFQGFPFLFWRARDDLLALPLRPNRGENAALQIQRSLALGIQRMHGHDTDIPVVADKHGGYRVIDHTRRMNDRRKPPSGNTRVKAVKQGWRIKPSAAPGVKEPATVMIGSPAPRLKTDPGPAESGIQDPLPIREGRPTEASSKRSPAVPISAAVKPGPIRIEAAEARRVGRRIGVLHRCRRRRGNRINAPGNPAVKFIQRGKAADAHGGFVTRLHGKRLAFFEERGLVFVQNGEMAAHVFDGAAIVIIVEAEGRAAVGLDNYDD